MAFKEWKIISGRAEGTRRLKRNEVTILQQEKTAGKGTSYTLTINFELSDELIRSGMTCLSISQDDITGEIALVFRKEGGIKLNSHGKACRPNLRLSNKGWVERLVKELGLKPNIRYILTLGENKSVRSDVRFYLINKPQAIDYGKF